MITINGNDLTIEEVIAVARHGEQVELAAEAYQAIERSHGWVEEILAANKPVYGINTGFGIFSDKKISNEDAAKLSRNLIISHAVATGPDLPKEVVRAAMLIRANTLAKGYSGCRPVVIETLLEMLNKGVTPLIPSQGSLGSSGDLAQLSHMALVFTTDEANREDESGWAEFKEQQMSGKSAMNAAGIPRLILGGKEGLAVNNGATFSAGIAALAVYDADILLQTAEVALAMSLEALLGVGAAFDPRIHLVRNHRGQIAVAERVRQLTEGSTLLDADGRVQDAYSLRCAPQVQGAAVDALLFIRDRIQREINAATDNPLIFGPGEALSGGNFHGEPIGMVMDFLKVALTEVAGISERRTFRLTDGKLNAGLPPMLVDNPEAAGLNSGMMMPQYTAASLVLESQTLASPDSVYSLPTSAEQEDHNANAMTAARHAREIVNNTAHVLAVEIYTAARALDLRLREMPEGKMGVGVSAAHTKVREQVPYQAGDAWWGPEIERVKQIIINGILI
ncbi:MAG: histidine ammonia-lyase [Chloroflexi bacterium]|nr:histidine ammonia-lyase [Chloroflexota bacterium]